MTDRHNAARVAAAKSYAGMKVLADEAWIPMPRTHSSIAADALVARLRNGGIPVYVRSRCESVSLDTPQELVSEVTTDPYAAEGKRLAIDDRQRRGKPGYFNWRQSIGDAYYDEQDRLSGRLVAAANDNVRVGRAAA